MPADNSFLRHFTNSGVSLCPYAADQFRRQRVMILLLCYRKRQAISQCLNDEFNHLSQPQPTQRGHPFHPITWSTSTWKYLPSVPFVTAISPPQVQMRSDAYIGITWWSVLPKFQWIFRCVLAYLKEGTSVRRSVRHTKQHQEHQTCFRQKLAEKITSKSA